MGGEPDDLGWQHIGPIAEGLAARAREDREKEMAAGREVRPTHRKGTPAAKVAPEAWREQERKEAEPEGPAKSWEETPPKGRLRAGHDTDAKLLSARGAKG